MIISTKKIEFDQDEISYQNTSVVTCCGKMEKSESIELNYGYDEVSCESNYSVKMITTDVSSDYAGGYDIDERYSKINYCPFCGNEIIIDVMETLDSHELYEQLQKQRENVWNRCKSTDSKKEESNLLDERRYLDDKIENMYMSDGF